VCEWCGCAHVAILVVDTREFNIFLLRKHLMTGKFQKKTGDLRHIINSFYLDVKKFTWEINKPTPGKFKLTPIFSCKIFYIENKKIMMVLRSPFFFKKNPVMKCLRSKKV
jgi:hypothetical protein